MALRRAGAAVSPPAAPPSPQSPLSPQKQGGSCQPRMTQGGGVGDQAKRVPKGAGKRKDGGSGLGFWQNLQQRRV